MKIGVYIENYRAGGLDRVVIDIIDHWPNNDDHFVIYCNSNHAGLLNYKDDIKRKVEYILYSAPWFMRFIIGRNHSRFLFQISRLFYNTVGCYLSMIWEVLKISKMFKTARLDAVMVHNGGWPASRTTRSAAIASKIVGIRKIVYVIHGLARSHHILIKLQETILEKLLVRIGVTFITVSNAARDSLKMYTALANINTIHNGIDEDFNSISSSQKDAGIRDELKIDDTVFLLAMFGTYEFYRGHSFIIRVMRRLTGTVPQSFLLIGGSGTDHEETVIKEAISSAGLCKNIKLLGFRNDVARIISNVDVVVNPVQNAESFGLVSVEAMAMKRPVVATRVGGNCEVVENDVTGFLVNQDDVKGFAEKLVRLSEDCDLRIRMGESGYSRYKNLFQASRMANEYSKALRH